MTKMPEAEAVRLTVGIASGLAFGGLFGWFIGRDYAKATIEMLTRQRDEARLENVGRLTHVYWQGIRQARLAEQERRRVALMAESRGRPA